MTDRSPHFPSDLAKAIELERSAPPPSAAAMEAVRSQVRLTVTPRRTQWVRFREWLGPNIALVAAFGMAVAVVILVRVPRSHDDPHGIRPLDSVSDNEPLAPNHDVIRPTPLGGPADAMPPPSHAPVLTTNPTFALIPLPPEPPTATSAPLDGSLVLDAAHAPEIDHSLEESSLLTLARQALDRHDVGGATLAVRLHLARFPFGRFAEEREVLAIRTLLLADRVDEARERAARFHRDHPESLAGPMIDALFPR